MGNLFQNSGPSLSNEDIANIERQIGKKLPDSLKSLYLSENGGVPDSCYWPLENGEYCMVQKFLRMKDSLGKGRTLEETYEFLLQKEIIDPDLTPFATDPGGNYFCIDNKGAVYFYATDDWYPELSMCENRQKARNHLCDSITDFVNGLEEDEPI